MDHWRSLLYPLGYLSALAFSSRFIIQWLQSEKAQKSIVNRSFWRFSLFGNLLLMIHSFIQLQYHVYLIQVCNGFIAWRNLNLMQKKSTPFSCAKAIMLFIVSLLLFSLAYFAQGYFLINDECCFRIPIAPWQTFASNQIPLFWHILGTAAYFLFSSRFWFQWWLAEKACESKLPFSFWMLSLIGAILSFVYFARIGDSVNLIGPMLGIVPYIRNLFLIKKNNPLTS